MAIRRTSYFTVAVAALQLLYCYSSSLAFHTLQKPLPRSSCTRTPLWYSLKPAASPLLDSGKALARSGELLIDATSSLDLYGGALSSTGANLRNAGDCVAQAAASCRFKTGAELVSDELREAATCILEGSKKLLPRAIEEAKVDSDETMASLLEATIKPMKETGEALEAAGAYIMQPGATAQQIGQQFVTGGKSMQSLSELLLELPSSTMNSKKNDSNNTGELVRLCCQRMQYAALKMIEAGNNLQGIAKETPKGKAWIKGGT